MGKNVYLNEVKWAVVKDKLSGKLMTKEVMEKDGIKNKLQVDTSYATQYFVKRHHLTSSMFRKGNCWDNAIIESFHSNLKSEEI